MTTIENLVAMHTMAHELGVCENSIRNYVKRGALDAPDCRIGKKIYWSRELANKAQEKFVRQGK